MGDVSKLPKWAQEQMAQMQMRARELEAERDQILAGGGGKHSHGFVFEGFTGQADVPAAMDGKRLVWRGSTGGIMLTQEVAKPSGKTWLHLNGLDGWGLQIRPVVANALSVRCFEHGEG